MPISKIKNIFFVFTLLFFSQKIYAESITLATLEWSPLVDSKRPDKGIVTKIVQDAFQAQGIATKIDFMPWARALESTQKGEYAALFPAYDSQERRKLFYYSNSVSTIKVGFIKLKETSIDYILTKNDLNKTYDILKKQNYKIGIIKGYANEGIFDSRTDLKKIVYGTDEQALKALISKKIDLYFADNIIYKDYLERKEPSLLNQVEFMEPAITEHGMHVIFPKQLPNSEILNAQFNAGLKKIKK